jgi:hypothetical protein
MEIADVLGALGSKRVIWIDDDFNQKLDLAEMLMKSIETTAKCKFSGIADLAEAYAISQEPTSIRQFVLDLKPEDQEKLKSEFFDLEKQDKNMPVSELDTDHVATACKVLGVTKADRWTFKKAHESLEAVCKADDSAVAYIVDLNESGGNAKEGMLILERLRSYGSLGTAFILTHEASLQSESQVEQDLRAELSKNDMAQDGLAVPVCVVSKERLVGDEAALAGALKVAIKRAGLRRSVHEVLNGAAGVVGQGFKDAADMLLQIPPEQLDEFVVERSYNEGVSELHVLERAITAKLGESLRALFATNDVVKRSTSRVRSLRAIELAANQGAPHSNLAAFRRLEVWESADLLNSAFTPIASGDVFESDDGEPAGGQAARRYLLLGQPCDISIRPNGKRDQSTAYFIPLKRREAAAQKAAKAKEALLQFQLDGQQWACDFRASSMINLSVLDLASLRADGRVRVDENQQATTDLLPGLAKTAESRLASAVSWLAKAGAQTNVPIQDFALQLSLRSDDVFKSIHLPELRGKVGGTTPLPRRVTWSLKRIGRVRMPFSSAMLRDYFAVVGREAFDLDFAPAVAAVAAPAAAA